MMPHSYYIKPNNPVLLSNCRLEEVTVAVGYSCKLSFRPGLHFTFEFDGS